MLPLPGELVEHLEHSSSVQPGSFVEAIFDLNPESGMRCAFTTDGQILAWDSHSHDLEIGILEAGAGDVDVIEMVAEVAGRYSFQWNNFTDSPVPLDMTIDFTGPVRFVDMVE